MLDPAEIIAGVGVEANGMKIKEVIRIINDIASKHDLVGTGTISRTYAPDCHQTQKYDERITSIKIKYF